MKILECLKLPETRCIKDIDARQGTLLHAEILQKKLFLKKLYIDFYNQLQKEVPDYEEKTLVEIGSGGGFIKQIISNVITSDILELPNVDKAFSASEMPFEDTSIDVFFMINVLHHIMEPRAFFREAIRCLKVAGKIIMIEPANTLWARFIYENFHHELFDTQSTWNLDMNDPLFNGNGAIPWIIFSRDRQAFINEFPSLKIVRIYNHTPLRYLLSGGFTLRQLVPSFSYPLFKAVEYILSPMNDWLSMFQTIKLEKVVCPCS